MKFGDNNEIKMALAFHDDSDDKWYLRNGRLKFQNDFLVSVEVEGAEVEAVRDSGEGLAVDRFGLAGAVPRGLVEKVEDRLAALGGVVGELIERLRRRRNAGGPGIAAGKAEPPRANAVNVTNSLLLGDHTWKAGVIQS